MKLKVIQQRSLWWGVSIAILLAGAIASGILWAQIGLPLRPSLDFVGGTRIQLQRDCTQAANCANPITLDEVNTVIAAQGLENSSVQILGQERQGVSIRSANLDVDQRSAFLKALNEKLGPFNSEATQIDTVGPTLGRQLFTSGMLALLLSLAGITVYLTFRFKLDYAILALIALLHDVFITVGIFAILGLTLGVEVDSLFIVALLTIVGFSVNDTVVIYDRIREVLSLNPELSINSVVEDAVNQTLARSINTTLTTLLPLTAIFILGGDTLKYFALSLIVGFVAGAYSSIFIASTTLAWWRNRTGPTGMVMAIADGDATDVSMGPEDS